jgi:hypothetical protein
MRLSSLLLPLLAVGLIASCSSTKKRSVSDPLGTEQKFCTAWAKAACNAKVVEACSGTAATDATTQACVTAQSSYCLGLVPPAYAPDHAQECIDAVKAAFADAKLTAEELALLREPLASPCDRLNKGPKGEGDTCFSPDDCNSLEGLVCVTKAGVSSGSCQVPVEVGGGLDCTGVAAVCAKGFYCDGSNCIGKKTSGQKCDESTPCADDFQCLGPTGSMTCQAKTDAGGTCTDNAQCKSGICAKPASGTGKCVPAVVLAPTEPMCADLS